MFRGSFISQVIAIIGTLFLAKIYGEEAYGFFGVFMSIISIVSIVSTLQLDKCIITSKHKKVSINWFNFLLFLVPLISISVSILLFLISNYFFDKRLDSNIIILATIGSLTFALNLINENYFTFNKQFSTISNARVFLTIGNVLLQFMLYTYYSLYGLIIGFLISQLLLLIYYLFKNRIVITTINFKKIKNGIKSNASIVKYLLPSNTINSLANHLMPILILTFFGAKEAGVYFFSIKILGTPLFLISSSISQVYFQKSSELLKENNNELLKLTKKIVTTNLLLMLGFLFLVNTIGMYILEYFFNENWNNLRLYTLILSILIFARTSFNPISNLIIVLNKNLESLIFNIYLLLI